MNKLELVGLPPKLNNLYPRASQPAASVAAQPPPAAPPLNPQPQYAPGNHPIEKLWQLFFKADHLATAKMADSMIPNCADTLHILGLSLAKLGRFDDALPRLRAAAIMTPNVHQRWSNASVAFHDGGRFKEAEELAEEGIKSLPEEPNLHFVHGNALMGQNRFSDAAKAYEIALQHKEGWMDAKLNLGNCKRRMEDIEGAETIYKEIMAADPKRQDAVINLASLESARGNDEEVKRLLNIAEPLGDSAFVAFMQALQHLADGDLPTGWRYYMRRHELPMAQAERKQWTKPEGRTLDEIRGKDVLVIHEQGFGDTLHFVRYVNLLQPHVRKIAFLCPQPLFRLMNASLNGVPVITDRKQAPFPFQFEVPLLNCPFLLGTTLETIPGKLPYLKVHPELPERRLPPRDPERPLRVGLCWAGQARPDPALAEVDGRRSTNLDTFGILADLKGIDWVSVQAGIPANQLHTPPEGMKFSAWVQPGWDFMDTGAMMQDLDLVISVDTSVCHLAGGLNVPVWILSRYDACWRWLRNREDTPWYPDAGRVFRMSQPNDWPEMMLRVKAAVREWAASKGVEA